MSIHNLESLLKRLTKIALINFVIYTVIALIIGGDAVNGYASSGHYYLRLGGYFNEVDYPLFLYSKIHTYILIMNYALFFYSSSITISQREIKTAVPNLID